MEKLIIIFLLFLSSCANISYTAPSGESLSYSRLGTQKITGLKIVRDKDGLAKFEFESQEGTIGDIAETLKNISAALLKIP